MAKYIGEVVFPSGEALFVVYDGTTDIARRTIYSSIEDAEANRTVFIANDNCQPAFDDVEVLVRPYGVHGSDTLSFHSTASSDRKRLTGPRSLEEAFSQRSRERVRD